MDDDDLGTLIHRAVATLEPPTQRLADGGLQRGRRQRRRRRLAGAGTAAALVTGVVAVSAALLVGGTGAGTGGGPDTPAAGGGAHLVAVTPQAVLQTALDTLPRPGETTKYAGASLDGYAGANFVYDDGHGAAAVQVAVGYPPAGAGPKNAGSVSPCAIKAGSRCTVLPSGAHLQLRQGHQYDDGRTPNAAEWEAQLVRPDGVNVTISEWNAPEPKDAGPTRADPPFTIDQLAAWVQDPAWRASIPAARAAATNGLFTPADLQAKVATVSRLDAADCEKAVRAHKVPAGSCKVGGH